VRAVGNLGQLAEHTARWRSASVQTQSHAIARLADSIATDASRTIDGSLTRARAIRHRMARSQRELDRKLAKVREERRARIEKQLRIERESADRLARRDFWDKLLLLSSLPLFAAYGKRGDPFDGKNLALLLSLLIFLVGDEVVDSLFGTQEPSPYPVRDTTVWTYLAPAANLLAGWWLLSDLQHERFIAGRSAFTEFDRPKTSPVPAIGGGTAILYQYIAEIDLRTVVGSDYREDFETFIDVPAVAIAQSVTFTAASSGLNPRFSALTAVVKRGKLIATFSVTADDTGAVTPPSIVSALEFAWMVDTDEPRSSTSTP
jgi:hypothetical protein